MQFDKEVWESRACEALLRCDSLSNLNEGELTMLNKQQCALLKLYKPPTQAKPQPKPEPELTMLDAFNSFTTQQYKESKSCQQ
jgi:hypothetical protein